MSAPENTPQTEHRDDGDATQAGARARVQGDEQALAATGVTEGVAEGGVGADITPEAIGAVVDALRDRAPLTQCVTNGVVMGFTANVLLAAGASPAMVDSIEEGPIFAGIADGLLINVGTVNATSDAAMRAIAAARAEAGRTWCLDPVAVGGLPMRTTLARDLLVHRPSVVRANASEVLGLAGQAGRGKGVDAGDDVDAALAAAADLAARTGGAVAVSGVADAIVTAGAPPLRLANGHALMTQVTGVGCSLGALVAAHLPVAGDPTLAAAAATAQLCVAADVAAERAAGPGSFAVELLDALARLDGDAVAGAVRLSEAPSRDGGATR